MVKYLDLITSGHAFEQLARDAKAGASHAYLIVSADRIAINLLARKFVCMVIGAEDGTTNERRVFENTMTDVILLPDSGDDKKKGKKEKVDVADIGYLTESALVTPTELNKKIYIIDYGETMTDEAQNKLLKTLEEPPGSVLIIILCANENSVLSTVRSRCRKVTVPPIALDKLENELKRYYPDDGRIALAVAASGGNLTEAENTLSDKRAAEIFRAVMDVLLYTLGSAQAARGAAKLATYKDDPKRVIDYIESIFMDTATYLAGKAQLTSGAGYLGEIRNLAREYNINSILGALDAVKRARARLRLNGNVIGIFDEMLFSILEVKAKCR